MDSPVFVRPAGNGPKGETGTTVKNQKTGGFLRPEGALIPPPQDADQHRMGVEVHDWLHTTEGALLYGRMTAELGEYLDIDSCRHGQLPAMAFMKEVGS